MTSEALLLAEELRKTLTGKDPGKHIDVCNKAIDELRRLHKEVESFRDGSERMSLKGVEMRREIERQHDRITALEAALTQAVEALESCGSDGDPLGAMWHNEELVGKAIATARQTLG